MRTPSVAGAQAHSVEALPAQPVDGEPLPAHFVGLAEQRGVAVVALGREALGVDHQQVLARPRSGAGGRAWPR